MDKLSGLRVVIQNEIITAKQGLNDIKKNISELTERNSYGAGYWEARKLTTQHHISVLENLMAVIEK